ncbi:MAG: Adenylate cyclase, partial [Mycobacterium sp.]|nr:Adenylate cyclase [Mycobacterium sp.]
MHPMTTTLKPDEPRIDKSVAAESAKRSRRRLMSRVSIQSKLLVMLLLTSILSAAIVGAIGYQSGRNS